MPHVKRWTIRYSTPGDIAAVRAWLLDEESRKVPGNFLCNWKQIRRAHEAGKLLVYIDCETSRPVGFQLGALVQPGILQVRSEYRRQGIGQRLVEHCVALAEERGHCLLCIECTPRSSIPFWERMGFTVIDRERGGNMACRVLTRQLFLPVDAVPVKVEIRIYPKERKWRETTAPYFTATPLAALAPDGTLHLAERVIFNRLAHPSVGDEVLELEVDGRCLFLDKAKYCKALALGVVECANGNGFYLDKIHSAAIAPMK